MIAPEAGLSVSRQYALLGVVRSSFYYRPRPESAEELELLKRLARIFTGHPVYGSRRLQVALLREGVSVGRRRIRRLMRKLGAVGGQAKAEHQQAAPRAQGLPVPSAWQDDRPGEPVAESQWGGLSPSKSPVLRSPIKECSFHNR